MDGRTLVKEREFVSMAMEVQLPGNGVGIRKVAGFAVGIRCDADGSVWASAAWAEVGEGYDGVHIFTPKGQRIGQILLPEVCSNVCFGGPQRNRLFMTASQSLHAVYVTTTPAATGFDPSAAGIAGTSTSTKRTPPPSMAGPSSAS